jgi:hypothetical protein
MLAELRGVRLPFAIWSGRRNDGAERLFLVSVENRGRLPADISRCALTPASPAVVLCDALVRRPPSRPPAPGDQAQVIGRAGFDVVRVERPDGQGGRQVAAVGNGWFALDVPNLAAGLVEVEAFDAEGRRVGRLVEPQGIAFLSWP